jgi:L-ascorbate metabolism protein UlaG (beta-lactamase superfamily)
VATLTFHGHATCTIETDDGTRIVIDPFFDDNPACDLKRSEVGRVDYILCTHGHTDHFADVVPLAKETGATVVATFEIVGFLGTQGVENTHPLHIGGGHDFPFGRVKMTPALHGGQVHGDETGQYTTLPAGLLIHVDGTRVHHAGDTALLTDMQLLRGSVDVALLPIGDNFTMGPEDAARAVSFIEPEVVIPIHYGTWPVIEQDPERFRELVGDTARVEILAAGDRLEL